MTFETLDCVNQNEVVAVITYENKLINKYHTASGLIIPTDKQLQCFVPPPPPPPTPNFFASKQGHTS